MKISDAVRTSKTKELKKAIKNGANVKEVDPNNQRTLLHIAAINNDHETINTLLDCEVDPSTKDDEGNTPLHLAAAVENVELVVIKEFLKRKGNKIDEVNNIGRTVLHVYAFRNNNPEIIRALRDVGYKPEAKDFQNNTPRDLACNNWRCNDSVIEALEENRANLNAHVTQEQNVMGQQELGQFLITRNQYSQTNEPNNRVTAIQNANRPNLRIS